MQASEDALALQAQMVALDPSRRISAQDALAHPYFRWQAYMCWEKIAAVARTQALCCIEQFCGWLWVMRSALDG